MLRASSYCHNKPQKLRQVSCSRMGLQAVCAGFCRLFLMLANCPASHTILMDAPFLYVFPGQSASFRLLTYGALLPALRAAAVGRAPGLGVHPARNRPSHESLVPCLKHSPSPTPPTAPPASSRHQSSSYFALVTAPLPALL